MSPRGGVLQHAAVDQGDSFACVITLGSFGVAQIGRRIVKLVGHVSLQSDVVVDVGGLVTPRPFYLTGTVKRINGQNGIALDSEQVLARLCVLHKVLSRKVCTKVRYSRGTYDSVV